MCKNDAVPSFLSTSQKVGWRGWQERDDDWKKTRRALCGPPRADFHVAEDQLGGFEDAPVARVRAALILFRDEGAVDGEEAPPGMNRIGPGLQVGGIGLGQLPRGGDLPVFALVGSQNRQQVRHELLVTGHGILHGLVPIGAPESAHSLTLYSTCGAAGAPAAMVRFMR